MVFTLLWVFFLFLEASDLISMQTNSAQFGGFPQRTKSCLLGGKCAHMYRAELFEEIGVTRQKETAIRV